MSGKKRLLGNSEISTDSAALSLGSFDLEFEGPQALDFSQIQRFHKIMF